MTNSLEQDRKYYWIAQISSWVTWSSLLGLYNYVNSTFAPIETMVISVSIVLLGIGISHLYRWYMIKDLWLKLPLIRLFPRVIIGSLITGALYTLGLSSILDLFFAKPDTALILAPPYDQVFELLITWILIFMIWSAAYLVYNYVKNYEHQEIRTLKLESSRNEMELNSLRAQLNPHFMFNAMNSIKALINEDPDQAKTAVTTLANILRNTLISGKKNIVSVEEELAIVKDHLAMEKIRYEERLNVEIRVEPESLSFKIPPLIIQTLVENAIKHGISKLPGGGVLKLSVRQIAEELKVVVENSGQYNEASRPETGIGLENTIKRLQIMYGEAASFSIKNKNKSTVISELIIPQYNES